jgi:hypothetical protein
MTPWARNIICNYQINFFANLAKAPTKITKLQNKMNWKAKMVKILLNFLNQIFYNPCPTKHKIA